MPEHQEEEDYCSLRTVFPVGGVLPPLNDYWGWGTVARAKRATNQHDNQDSPVEKQQREKHFVGPGAGRGPGRVKRGFWFSTRWAPPPRGRGQTGGTAPGGRPGRNARGGRKPAPNVRAGASRRGAKAGRCPRTCGRREAPSVTGARWSGGSRGTWTTAPRSAGRASGELGSRPMLPGGQYRPAPIAAPHPAQPGGRPLGQAGRGIRIKSVARRSPGPRAAQPLKVFLKSGKMG